MIITPPEELLVYISTDEKGNWIHDPEMPEELESKFHEFVEEEAKIRNKMQKS